MATRRKPRRTRKVYSFIVDGETEKWYLQLMRDFEKDSIPTVHIKPEIPKKKSLEDLRTQIIEHAEEYDRVFWIVDLDVIVRDGLFAKFAEIVRELKKIENVFILVNSPCLEFWFLLHFRETGKIYSDCCRVESELRKLPSLKGYAKTEKYYKSGVGIYARLKKHLESAIRHSGKLDGLSLDKSDQALAEIGRLFELLGI